MLDVASGADRAGEGAANPTLDESFVVIRFKDPDKFRVDFPYLLSMISGAFMSRRNTIVVPGGKMGLAIEIIFTPIVVDMMKRKDTERPRLSVADQRGLRIT